MPIASSLSMLSLLGVNDPNLGQNVLWNVSRAQISLLKKLESMEWKNNTV